MSMKLLFGQVLFLIAITFGLESNSSAQYSYGGTILTVDSLVNGMHGHAFDADDHLEAKSTGQGYNSASSAGDMHFALSMVVDAYMMDGTVQKDVGGDTDHDLFVAPGNSSTILSPKEDWDPGVNVAWYHVRIYLSASDGINLDDLVDDPEYTYFIRM